MISLARIKDRKLGQWALAYLAGAWLSLQVIKLVSDSFGWSGAWVRSLIVVLSVGFFAVLVLAWYHGERRLQRVGRVELAILTALLGIAGLGVALVGGDSEAESAPLTVAAPPEVPVEQASLAVLPFENLSSDPEQAYFSDGLTEELLNALAQVPGLRVVARTSAFAFRGGEATADSIGRALRVVHLVEGSVRKAGDRVRITVQLVDARSGVSQWSQSYDRELADVFAVQDEIGRAIAGELSVRVGGGPLVAEATADPEAHALFLRASQVRRAGGAPAEFLPEAERLFEAALARDPGYAAALAGLAEVHQTGAYFGVTPKEAGYERARAEGERALALDPEEATASAVLGRIEDFYDRDYAAAAAHYRRSLELNPSDARTRSLYGWLLMRLGRRGEALREGQRAVDLDPLSPGALNNLGALYAYADDPARAAEQNLAALALSPENPIILGNLAITQAALGQYAEAVRTAERALALDPEGVFALSTAGYLYGRAGRRDEAERARDRLAALPDASPYLLATVEMGLGNRERAFALLERAAEAQDDLVGDLGMDPVFKPLRGDPRFGRLLERLGLPAPRVR